MILIDNDVLSQLNRPRPDPRILAWFGQLRPSEFGIAGVTVFEQFRGIELARSRSPTLAYTLSLWWEGFLATLAPEQLVAAQVDVLREQAKLYALPPLNNFISSHGPGTGQVKTGGDLILAATAIARQMPIATLNVADFMEIHSECHLPGLLDPRSATWHVPNAPASRPVGTAPFAKAIDEKPFVEALGKVAWSWPYSLAVAQGQSATLVELLKASVKDTGIEIEREVGFRLARASDRGALIRYVRKVAEALDPASRTDLAKAMLGELDELDTEIEPKSGLEP